MKCRFITTECKKQWTEAGGSAARQRWKQQFFLDCNLWKGKKHGTLLQLSGSVECKNSYKYLDGKIQQNESTNCLKI